MNFYELLETLKMAEGFRASAYQDSEGFWTIGYGVLIDKRRGGGITKDEATHLLANRVRLVERDLDQRLAWWRQLDEVRQRAVAEMAYQLGVPGLLKFKRALRALEEGRYDEAADHLLDSKWAREQTPGRAKRIAAMISTGFDQA